MSRYNEALDTKRVGPFTVEIFPDECCDHENPAENDKENGLHFVTFERRSTLSDLHGYSDPETAREDAESKGWFVFPLYKYEHGRVAYNISAYSCPWDSGQVGFIFLDPEGFGDKNITEARAAAICKSFAESVAGWCNGDYWGFVVKDADGETLDSCWGFDDSDYCMKEGVEAAEYEIEKRRKARQATLKELIRNHVPLNARPERLASIGA